MVDIELTDALADAVLAARTSRGWTQEDVTSHGGPSKPTIRRIEKRRGHPISPSTAKDLERAFGWPEGTARMIARGEVSYDPATGNGDALRNAAAHMSRAEIAQAMREWSPVQWAQQLKVSPQLIERWQRGEAEMPERVEDEIAIILADKLPADVIYKAAEVVSRRATGR